MRGELNSREEVEKFHTSAGGIFGGRHSEISYLVFSSSLLCFPLGKQNAIEMIRVANMETALVQKAQEAPYRSCR